MKEIFSAIIKFFKNILVLAIFAVIIFVINLPVWWLLSKVAEFRMYETYCITLVVTLALIFILGKPKENKQ